MDRRFEGKVALITGGAGGIGRATAVRLAAEGARIAAVDVSKPGLAETVAAVAQAGGEAIALEADVTRDTEVEGYAAAARARFGRVDAFFNNAGILGETKSITDYPEDAFDRVIAINLKGVWLGLKHVGAAMVAQGGGAIVNTASTSGTRYTGSPQIGYASSKAAVIQFSRVTAVQYAKNGVRVNTVVPGQMHTPMVEARLAKQRTGGDVEALLKSRVARIPLGFMGDGRDTAHAVLFLASDEARFITGTEIVVDGGMTARCD